MSRTARIVTALLASICPLLVLPGCGVGALIAAGVAALVVSDDGGSSGSAPISQAILDSSLTREDLVTAGSADVVPICYHIEGGAAPDAVRVQYSARSPAGAFESWLPATAAANPPAGLCGDLTFWWDAAADLGLNSPSVSEEVRVRIFVGEDAARAHVSASFVVGNTPHELNLFVLGTVSDEVEILFVARDVDGPGGDRLRDVRLQYRLPDEPDSRSCSGEPGGPVGECGDEVAPDVDADGWIDIRHLTPSLDEELAAPPLGRQYRHVWSSRCAAGIGNRDVSDAELRVVARDGFGVEREAVTPFGVANNRPPRVRFLGTNPDEQTGFELALVLEALDVDGDALDVVLQYATERQDFVALDASFDDCSARRDRLSSSEAEFVELRRRLRIVSLSRRAAGQSMRGLAASGAGVRHLLVWDSEKDLGPFQRQRVRIRATAFDSSRGAEPATVELAVDNSVLTPGESFAEGVSVAGLAAGDIDGDGRTDLAVSHTRAGDDSRVAIHLQRADGSFSTDEDTSVRPGVGGESTPIGLVLSDLDGDGVLDLVALNNNCRAGAGCAASGDVSVYWGDAGSQLRFSDPADLVLTAGRDVRDIAVGEFDGLAGADIAVSNHDDLDVGVFFRTGPRSFASAMERIPVGDETGSLAVGNFDGDSGEVLEIVVRKRNPPSSVDFYRWSPSMRRFETWEQIPIPSPVSLVARDLNRDGLVDLAVGSRGLRSVTIYANSSTPDRSEFEPTAEFCLDGSPEQFVLADLLGDGRRSIVALDRDRQRVEVVLEDAARICCQDAAACSSSEIPLLIPGQDSALQGTVLAADLDGDGRDDLIFGSLGGAPVFRARSAGSLVPELSRSLFLDSDDRPARLLAGDMDGDSLLDLGVAFPPVRGGTAARAYGMHLFVQGEVGEFSRIPTRTLRSPTENPQTELYALEDDVDGDGRIDYLAMSHDGGIVLFARDGGLFATEPTVSVPGAPPCGAGAGAPPEVFPAGPLLGGDFDEAHEREILHFDGGRRKLGLIGLDRVAEGDALSVSVQASMCLSGFPESVAAADMDGDGLEDLVVLDRSAELSVRLRDATRPWPASFESVDARIDLSAVVAVQSTFGEVLATDADADGRADLIAVDSGPGLAKKIWGFRQLVAENGEKLGAFELQYELDPLEAGEGDDFRIRLGETRLIDLTGDELPDLVVVVESPPMARVAIFHQARSGGFPSAPSRTIPVTENLGGRILIDGFDLSGDLRPELLLGIPGGSASPNELRILRTR